MITIPSKIGEIREEERKERGKEGGGKILRIL